MRQTFPKKEVAVEMKERKCSIMPGMLTITAAPADFEFLAIFLSPSSMQYITAVVVAVIIIPYGEVVLVVSHR